MAVPVVHHDIRPFEKSDHLRPKLIFFPKTVTDRLSRGARKATARRPRSDHGRTATSLSAPIG